MQKLNRRIFSDSTIYPSRIIQFGGGNFIRGFCDWMVQVLNEDAGFNSGVILIKPTKSGHYDNLAIQDNLFSSVLSETRDGRIFYDKKIITCINEIINPYENWKAFLDSAKIPDIRFIFSNTTEAGIRYDDSDNDPETIANSFPGKLTQWLFKRYEAFGGSQDKGCLILPTELIENNGEELESLVIKYSQRWDLDDGFRDWINQSNHFFKTMVDRIISGYPKNNQDYYWEKIGYQDEALVVGEFYHNWIIEDRNNILEKEMPYKIVGFNINSVDDLGPYRAMKVKLLNGAHTAMFILGTQMGLKTVAEAIKHPILGDFIKNLIQDEVIVTSGSLNELYKKFAKETFLRFDNIEMNHLLESIGLNTTSKINYRLLSSMNDYIRLYEKIPEMLTFVMAAFFQNYSIRIKTNEFKINDATEIIGLFKNLIQTYPNDKIRVIEKFIHDCEQWEINVTHKDQVINQIAHYWQSIDSEGIESCIIKFQTE